ncbi:MAG: YihY/virulence factor BrkB family protein [Odoribacter sp.]|nr:YihY/virulence factor BrkB family protein [Odoribacter sp.]
MKTLAIIVVSIDRFLKDGCTVSASALTFYSVLSFIPVVALIMGIAKGFGSSSFLEEQLREQFANNPQLIDMIMELADNALNNTNGGLIAGIGIVILIWSVIRVLSNTEKVMNRIWGVSRGRSLGKKFTDYLSITFIAPILAILIGSFNIFLTSNLQEIAMEEGFLRYASSLIIDLMKLVPYILVWFLFTFIYMYMPTVPIKLKYALLAGIIAGTVYQIVQWFYIRFQIGVSSYNVIYGSIAAFPLLLVWLQLSWCIVLWGTELCYMFRNRHFLYHNSITNENLWIYNIEQSIKVLRYVSQEYMLDKGGPTLGMISKKLKISGRRLRTIMEELVDKNILAEVRQPDDIIYLPLIDFHHLSLADVIICLSYMDETKGEEWEKRLAQLIRKEFGGDIFVQ